MQFGLLKTNTCKGSPIISTFNIPTITPDRKSSLAAETGETKKRQKEDGDERTSVRRRRAMMGPVLDVSEIVKRKGEAAKEP